MYNKVILEGNLTKDIELIYASSGTAIGKSSIAVNRKFKTQAGEQKQEVLFIDITFFGRTAEVASQYLTKGSNIIIDGKLDFQQWKASDGTNRSKHAVTVNSMQMINTKKENVTHSEKPKNLHQPEKSEINLNVDEIPF